jgi:hypothetical protein
MTQEFKRERRYVVLKLKDADNIPNPVRERLDDALREANQYLPDREYVVIESDWPEYEVAWKMIEARCGGAAQAQQTTEKGTACSTSNFRKKPVVIQAKQLTEETIREVYEWVHGPVTLKHRLAEDRWDDYCGIVKTDGMNIPTLEDGSDGRAKHVASIGDWIIRGIAGEFYPCKPDIFAATYEPVAQAQQTTEPELPEPVIAREEYAVGTGEFYTAAIRKVFIEEPTKFDPREYLTPAREAHKKIVVERMKQFGAAGHAKDYKPMTLAENKAYYESKGK